MTRWVFADDHPIEGEIWKNTPCGLAYVSDQGRMKNLAGELAKAYRASGGDNVFWRVRNGGRVIMYRPPTLVAQVFLGGCPGRGGVVEYRNGDPTDWRAANLVTPWSAIQDEAILAAVSCKAAAAAVGRGVYATRSRARTLGKIWTRTLSKAVPLSDRVEVVKEAAGVLELAGVPDETINLALSVDGRKKYAWGRPIDPDAKPICLRTLHEAGWLPEKIALAFGYVSGAAVARQKLRDLGLIAQTGWEGRTPLGHPDPIEGEEWRRHGWGYWVSSLGRVASKHGLMTSSISAGRVSPCVNVVRPDGSHTSVLVARLMLAVFRPDLPYSRKVFRNGDPSDVRLANIGLPVSAEALRQIRQRLPVGLAPQDRKDAEQAAVLALMEGRAPTPAEAVRIGVREMHEIAGTHRNVSLDKEMSPGSTGHDFLMSDGTFTSREQASGSGRSRAR